MKKKTIKIDPKELKELEKATIDCIMQNEVP